VGTQTFTVLAEELGGTARAELWPKLVAEWPKPVAGPLTSAQPKQGPPGSFRCPC
jgi:hypothetical protein